MDCGSWALELLLAQMVHFYFCISESSLKSRLRNFVYHSLSILYFPKVDTFFLLVK